MNTILIATILAAGPMSAAINQASPAKPVPMPAEQWVAKVAGNTTIELPVPEAIETQEFKRTAPANYRIPSTHWTTRIPVWCPAKPEWRHGYSCNMSRLAEDLFGHLQAEHGITLEVCNEVGRENLQSFHEELHWCDETEARQQLFLNPQPAKPAPVKSGCGPNGCPSRSVQSFRSRGWF